jgi:inorganic pyrophosphatase
VHDIHDIQPEFRDEIEHFVQVYKDLEDAKTETRGFGNRAEAERALAAGSLPRDWGETNPGRSI